MKRNHVNWCKILYPSAETRDVSQELKSCIGTNAAIDTHRASFPLQGCPSRFFFCTRPYFWSMCYVLILLCEGNECMEFLHLQNYSKYFESTTGILILCGGLKHVLLLPYLGTWFDLTSIFVQVVCSTTNHRIISKFDAPKSPRFKCWTCCGGITWICIS